MYRGTIRGRGSLCLWGEGLVPLQHPLGYRLLPRKASQSTCSKHNTSPETPQNAKSLSHAKDATIKKPSVLSSSFWSCRSTWRRAGINTLRCLIGCTVGDFSALWTLQSYYPELGMNSIMLASSKYQGGGSPTTRRSNMHKVNVRNVRNKKPQLTQNGKKWPRALQPRLFSKQYY